MIRLLALTHLLLFLRLLVDEVTPGWLIQYPKFALWLGVFFSICLIVGRKLAPAFIVSIVALWLSLSNPATRSVSHEFLLWISLASCFGGQVKSLRLPKDWYLSGLWIFFGINYFFSGFAKVQNSFWSSGQALDIIMQSHAANLSVFSNLLRALPLNALSYLVLFIELIVPIAAVLKVSRKWVWLSLMLLQIGILLTLRMQEISMVMLIVQMSLYQREWFPLVGDVWDTSSKRIRSFASSE